MDGNAAHGLPGLISARRRKGWSQREAAEEAGVSSTTWSRWERGVQNVEPHHRARIAEVFQALPDEVERWLDGKDSEPLPWRKATTGPLGLDATVEEATHLWRWDMDPSRRALLSSLPFVPGFLGEWLLSWQLDPAAESRAHEGKGPRVGLEDVRYVRDAIDTFSGMDHQFGGGIVLPIIVDFLNHHLQPLLRGSYNDEVGSQLMTTAAIMTGMAGWEAYDLSLYGLAQEHYGQALNLAKAADDPITSAWIFSIMAQLAIDLRNPGWATRLARAAYQAAEKAESSPRVRAKLLLREARATALRVQLSDTPDPHTASRVEKLLAKVETTYAQAHETDDDPAWVHDLNAPEIAAESGCVWHMIGNHQQAVESSEFALAGFAATRPRSIQFNRMHRAQALLGMGDLDGAVSSARTAIPSTNALKSKRANSLVLRFSEQLKPYSKTLQFAEWNDYLSSELRPAVI